MLRLFERSVAAAGQRLVLLAPSGASIPRALRNVAVDADEHRFLLADLQRARGRIYVRDGALGRDELTVDGRHRTPEDERAWHLLVVGRDREIGGCIWYLEHEAPALDELRVRHCPLMRQQDWRDKIRAAIDAELARARQERIPYAEVGGWAVTCGRDCLSAALLLVLGTYGLSQIAGGALVVATATARHSSAKILRRLGGSQLMGDGFVVPPYYDPRYDCEMEILRFDTRRPTAKYADAVEHLKRQLANVQVFANTNTAREFASARGFLPETMQALAAV